ncbi:MAG: hypothetical protein OFPII_03510 [Osedax symbiont Rs1]|nr:MAG: hypothetical protein OFPII_03510 [Osedax symbiont Rs1]
MKHINLKKLSSLSLGLITVFGSSLSQATSLEEVYRLAFSADPQLQQAAYQLIYSDENVLQAKAALLPTIDGKLTANWQDNSDSKASDSKSYSIHLKQELYSPALGSAYNKVKILDQQANLILKQSQQQLIIRTVIAYTDSMIAKSNLSTTRAQERSIKQRLDRVNAEFEVGIIAITDVHEAKASYDNAKVDVIISVGALQNSLEALQRLTGTLIKEVDSLTKNYPIKNLDPNLPDHWIAQALANNTALLIGKKTREAAHQDTDIASANLKPSVKLQASHSRSDHSFNGTSSDNQIAIVLNLPLYNGGSLNSKVRQSLSAENIAQSKQQDNIRAVTQTTRSLIRDIQTNVLSISARQQSILSSKAALEAISEGFNVGTRNIVDLLQAEQAVFSAENKYATARLNHIRLFFKLKFQLGSVNEQDITELAKWMEAS